MCKVLCELPMGRGQWQLLDRGARSPCLRALLDHGILSIIVEKPVYLSRTFFSGSSHIFPLQPVSTLSTNPQLE